MILKSDDVYLLGSIGMTSVIMGHGEEAVPILKLVKELRPRNAGGFIMQALYLYTIGEVEEAMAVMQDAITMDAEANHEEALSFHLFLLFHTGNIEDCHELAEVYLKDHLVMSSVPKSIVEDIYLSTSDILGYTAELTE